MHSVTNFLISLLELGGVFFFFLALVWQTIFYPPQKASSELSLAAEVRLPFVICHHLSHFLKKISVDHAPICWGQLSIKTDPGPFIFRPGSCCRPKADAALKG